MDIPAVFGLSCEICAKINFWKQNDKGSMILHSLSYTIEFGPKLIFRSKLERGLIFLHRTDKGSCIPWFVMWNLAQNQFLEANCSIFLHSLAFNMEFGPKPN